MRRCIALPLLRDRHNHPSLYAALRDAPILAGLRAPEATARIESLPRDRLTIDELTAGFGAAPGDGTAVYEIDDDARTVRNITDGG